MSIEPERATWRIGLASVPNEPTVAGRLVTAERTLSDAATRDADIVCFPETYFPGLRGMDFDVPPYDHAVQEQVLRRIAALAGQLDVAVILPMEWASDAGQLNLAWVIDRTGTVVGHQAKNQIAPSEDPFYVADPSGARRVFTLDGVPFGITICHEGWRYPEATRWLARRGAQIVFHPQMTGSDDHGIVPARWADPDAPYYEKAMIARTVENSIYFASVNYAVAHQESATCIVGPDGDLVRAAPYREAALLIHDVDLARATGDMAARFDETMYPAEPAAPPRRP
ncbi:MAG TPA: carbon-nitrogen hydrolase family protein [Thermomicrobiales bacterium]|jgi:predicted amidohydrolase|nr:carbon-nitrogen hydrolase family protein [Thermomicrobiales bacterium]